MKILHAKYAFGQNSAQAETSECRRIYFGTIRKIMQTTQTFDDIFFNI